MALQQTVISLQSGPVEVRLARVLEELDRERQAVGGDSTFTPAGVAAGASRL